MYSPQTYHPMFQKVLAPSRRSLPSTMVYLIPDLPKVTENKQTYHQINQKKTKISIGHFTIRGHGVILLLLPESYSVLICFLAQIILGLLLIKPRWDYQIYFSVNLYRKKKDVIMQMEYCSHMTKLNIWLCIIFSTQTIKSSELWFVLVING